MIEIELTMALAVYSVFIGAVVLSIWLYTELSVHRPQRHLGRQFLWRCTFCGCSYLDESAQTMSQCPRCANYNLMEEAAESPRRALQPTPAVESTQDDAGEKGRGGSKRKRRGRHRGGRKRR